MHSNFSQGKFGNEHLRGGGRMVLASGGRVAVKQGLQAGKRILANLRNISNQEMEVEEVEGNG